MSDNDHAIRIVERRLAAERNSLVEGAQKLDATVRDTLVSPRALLAAAAAGFLLGEALRPFHRPSPTRKHALAGTLGAAALTLLQAYYGLPGQLARKRVRDEAARACLKKTSPPGRS